MKNFLTFGFGASGGTSQVPLRYRIFEDHFGVIVKPQQNDNNEKT